MGGKEVVMDGIHRAVLGDEPLRRPHHHIFSEANVDG